jgi:hypothetical protein
MGWTVFFIVFFGIAALIPATWSIIGLIRGNTRFWPAVVGTGFAVGLLLVTFIGAATNWGGCPVNSVNTGSSAGAVKCYAPGSDEPRCEPDVWKVECRQALPPCGGAAIPAGRFCPAGQTAVFPFCEPIQFGGIKQPWATWSDLSFIAAGLWILWLFHYFAREGTTSSGTTFISMSADNPMITIGVLSITYGMIAIFMGPPSQWFHASMKDWAGWFDSMSVGVWLSFNAVYVLYMVVFAMWGNGRGVVRTITVMCVWAGLLVIFGIVGINPKSRLFIYLISGGLWGVAEVIYIFVAAFARGVTYRRTWWLFIINVSLLAVTMGLWVLFNDEIVTTACEGRKDFPGHAVFHILASFSTILTFFSFASERRVE